MNCPDCRDFFAAELEGLLGEDASHQLEAHLAVCPACRAALDETRRLFDRLGQDAQEAPEFSITNSVMDRIVREQALQLRSDKAMRRIAKFAAAAAVLIVAGIAISHPITGPAGGRLHADVLSKARERVEGAKSATWKVSYYEQLCSEDRKKTRWFKDSNNELRFAYQSPGRYRREDLNKDGEVVFASIEDQVSQARLDIDYKQKTATLTPLGASPSAYHPDGPFGKYLDLMKRDDLKSLGKSDVAGREANGFRYAFFDRVIERDYSYNFWIDAVTKRLVLCRDPGGDIFDPAQIVQDREVAFPVKGIEYRGTVFLPNQDEGGQPGHTGYILRDIAFDVVLDDSLFSLIPPEGFALKAVEPPPITEQDIIAFIDIVANYFGGTFPDRFPYFNHEGDEYLRFERVERDVQKRWRGEPLAEGREPMPAEMKMVEAMHKWWQTGIPGPGPMHVFINRIIAKGSWKYLGKGVRLGDKDKIVCWYRPKNSRTYRVVYGDLNVEDVAPEGLPLPVER